MSTGKRGGGGGGKRSGVMGMRVAAKKDSTGWYEAATICDIGAGTGTSSALTVDSVDTTSSSMPTSQKLRLSFDDGSTGWYAERHIIGPGFQSMSSASLTTGQVVYCTVGHREMSGKVVVIPPAGSELLQITLDDDNGQSITRKVEDLRLIKSRKSSRQIADKDYLSLASGRSDAVQELETVKEPVANKTATTTGRKRAMPLDIVTSGVERVKSSHTFKPGKTRAAPTIPRSPKSFDRESLEDELPYMPMEDGESEDSDSLVPEDEEEPDELMDECSAALVLMSLHASPVKRATTLDGPTTRKTIDQQEDGGFSSSSVPTPGFYGSSWPVSGNNMGDLVHGRRRSARRPYVCSMKEWRLAGSSDEGIEVGSTSGSSQLDPCMLDHDYSLGTASSESTQDSPMEPYTFQRTRKQRPSNCNMVIMFQCTWPECYHMENSRNSIKRHIENVHFTSAGLRSDDLDFYYDEVETLAYGGDPCEPLSTPSTPPSVEKEMVDVVYSDTSTSSPATVDRHGYGTRHRQRSTMSCSSDASTSNFSRSSKYPPTSAGITIPRSSKLRRHHNDWQSASAPQSDKYYDLVSSPTSSSSHVSKKMRDIKKCRKVYGMENREQWCTQCKWKKACTRFAHENA